MTYKFSLALTASLVIASLGACSRSTEAPMPSGNTSDARPEPNDDATATVRDTRPPDPEPTAAADTNMTAAVSEKAPVPTPDEQLMDDASATGMTARSTRDDQARQIAPAERPEKD